MRTSTRAWLLLLASAVLETVWAVALSESAGMTRPGPAVTFVVAAVLSLAGFGIASRHIPIGTAYGVWVGIGAIGTVAYSVLTGQDQLSPLGWVCMACIIGAVVGLRLTTPDPAGAGPPEAAADVPADVPADGETSPDARS